MYKDVIFLCEDLPYIAPDIPVSRYTKAECKALFTAHGKTFKSNDTVSILCLVVARAVTNMHAVPTLVGPEGGATHLVENVIISLCAMVCACMGPSVCLETLPDAVDYCIKLFLSAVNDLEKCRPGSAA